MSIPEEQDDCIAIYNYVSGFLCLNMVIANINIYLSIVTLVPLCNAYTFESIVHDCCGLV